MTQGEATVDWKLNQSNCDPILRFDEDFIQGAVQYLKCKFADKKYCLNTLI